jgi:hypothetical protein
MSTNTIDAVRQQNEQSAAFTKNVTISDLDGFQLPSDVTEEFLERMQKEVTILGMADTMTLRRLEQEVPQFGVPRLSGGQRSEETSRTSDSSPDTGHVKFNATDKSYYILVEPNRDALKNTHQGPDNLGDYIVQQFIQRWGNDVGLIGIRAGASSDDLQSSFSSVTSSTLDDTWDGWIARAEDDTQSDDGSSTRIGLEDTATADASSMPTNDMSSAPPDTKMFNDTIQTLDSRFRNSDDYNAAFLLSPDKVQEYVYSLTEREDALGSAVVFGDSEITPFSYDLIGVNGWPDSYGMFTDPNNLKFGLYENMEVDQTTDTDKVHENRLHSRNWIEGQMDFQIGHQQAGVLITNIA